MRFRAPIGKPLFHGALVLALFMMCASLLSTNMGAQDEGVGWRIVRAQYGWRDRQTDVTDLLQDLIGRGGVNGRVVVNNQTMGGDPAVSQDKTLRIIARNQQNQEREFLYKEGAAIDVGMFAAPRDKFDDRPRGDSRRDDRYNQNRQNSGDNRNYNDPNNGNNNYSSRGDNQPEYLPAGTRLAILTNEQIDSNSANTNQIYSGQVDQVVTDNAGEIIISRGSAAELVIRTFSSGNDMTLDVQAITVNGRRYRISTAPLRQTGRSGLGKNKRTVEMVGGGALIGTIIGAVVGHGEGAAIGAAVGAAGGAGAQVLTKGKQVSIPAETVLTFRLNNSVTLAPDEQ